MLAIIDKPTWFTSFDVIRKLKKLYPKTKIWHSGTLDPLATWVLVIWIWKSTKKLWQIQWMWKEYEATIDFSKLSDTWDIDYWDEEKYFEYKFENNWLIIDWKKIIAPTLEEIQSKLDLIIPEYELPLPAFSAKKIDWKKSYDLARNWEILERKQIMRIYSYEIIDYSFPLLKVKIKVGSWTYIRSIAYWLWSQFNLGWILIQLRRTSIGDYSL
jgi:tRNA pseudouridine55 synthase